MLLLLKKFLVRILLDALLIVAKPNSLCLDFLTLPPNNLDNIWCPKHIPRIGTPSFKSFYQI